MLQSFYGRKYLIVSLIVIILDGIIRYYFPGYFNKLNYFYPMLTISFIPFIYLSRKNYYLLICLISIIYDLLYSNIFLYHLILFIFLMNLDIKISKYFNNSLIKNNIKIDLKTIS